MAQRIINQLGQVAGWNSVKMDVLGRVPVGVTEISYMIEQEKENVYGLGVDPIGQSVGNRTAKASITLTLEERLALLGSIPEGTTLMDIPAFDITVSYLYGTKVFTDVLRNCQFKNDGVETKQNDKSIQIKYDLLISHIDANVK